MLAIHLACRYLRKRRIAWLAIVTCMLSVAIPVTVIGVIQGFVDISERQLHGAESDLVLKSFNAYALPQFDEHIEILKQHSDIVDAAPFIKSYAVLTPRSRNENNDIEQKPKDKVDNENSEDAKKDARYNTGCQIEGVVWSKEQNISRLSNSMLHKRPGLDLSAENLTIDERGSGFLTPAWRAHLALSASQCLIGIGGLAFPLEMDEPPIGVILGHELIYSNGIQTFWPGQIVMLTIPNNKGGVLGKVAAEISDTIGTGYLEFDRTMAVLPLNYAQQLTDMDHEPLEISGYRIRLKEGVDAHVAKEDLSTNALYRLWWQGYSVLAWDEMGSINMVKTFEIQRNIMILVMLLVQAQCVFIVYAVFSTLVSEKRHDIGILLGIGAKRSQILNTFITASLFVCTLGGLLGWGVAWGILGLLNPVSTYFDIALFPQDVIYTPEAPISWDYRIPLFFLGVMLVIGFISVLIPAYRASRITPLESIREHN